MAGFYLGCRILGLWPHWPPREDADRLLIIVLPVAAAIELLAGIPRLPRRLIDGLRLIVAGGTARVLLEGTTYISHASGPNSRVWSAGQVWLVLASLTLAVVAVWWAIVTLGRRTADFSLPLCLAIACCGTGLTVMLSGYMSGGQLGLPFAAALVGAALSTLALAKPLELSGILGISTIMNFGLLVAGHFFGELTNIHAGLLLVSPLAAWLPELLPRSISSVVRGWLRVLLVSVAVGGVVASAGLKFAASSQPRPDRSREWKTITDSAAVRPNGRISGPFSAVPLRNPPRPKLPSLLF